MSRPSLPAAFETLLRAIGAGAEGHAVFSRKGTPLLLLPADRRVAAATAETYRPQSAKAKAAAAALRALCRAGLHAAVLPRLAGTPDRSGALLCNPCHGVRVVAVRPGPGGLLEAVKAARPSDGAPLVREREALARLAGRPGVPAAGPLERSADAVSFAMPLLGNANGPENHAALLAQWATGPEEPAGKNGLVAELSPLLGETARRALRGATVRRALVHGDFAPWNWRADGEGRPVCIDWEWAREDGFAGFDAAYWTVQTELLVRKTPPERLLGAVERDLRFLPRAAREAVAGCGLGLETLVALVAAYRKSKGMT